MHLQRDSGAEGVGKEINEKGLEEVFLKVDLDILIKGVGGEAGMCGLNEAFCVDLTEHSSAQKI